MTPDAAHLELPVDHLMVHRDVHAYSAHPHLAVAGNGDWLLVFTQSRRRAGVLHPPQDPLYSNMLMRSHDEGRSWSQPSVVPTFGWQGVECAGLTVLRTGTILLNQWRFHWHTLAEAEVRLDRRDYRRAEELMGAEAMVAELDAWAQDPATLAARYPWARGGGETWVHRSLDVGTTFTDSIRVDTAPFSGGYGMRGGFEIDGEVVLPLCDVPHYRSIFTIRSCDEGATWSVPALVASGADHEFEEPASIVLKCGRVVMLLRDNASRILHSLYSQDSGLSWSEPIPTGIPDYPADMVELADGRIACVAGRRRKPFAITLYLSEDRGRSWSADRPGFVRSGLPNKDLGYPSVALRTDGSLFVVYYAQEPDGVTSIQASVVAPDACQRRKKEIPYG